jgi:hypothetical protein
VPWNKLLIPEAEALLLKGGTLGAEDPSLQRVCQLSVLMSLRKAVVKLVLDFWECWKHYTVGSELTHGDKDAFQDDAHRNRKRRKETGSLLVCTFVRA